MKRTAVYVDGGLFTEAVRGQGMSMDMDFMGLIEHFTAGSEVVAVDFVVPEFPAHPYPNKHRNQKKQLESYAEQGVSVVYCQPQVINSIFVDRGIEATITAKAVLGAASNSYDTALFISCRAELAPAIEAVKSLGKVVEVAFFRYEAAPVNPLDAVADSRRTISIDDVVSRRKSGPAPYALPDAGRKTGAASSAI